MMTISHRCHLISLPRVLDRGWRAQRAFSSQRTGLFSSIKTEETENPHHISYLQQQEIPPFVKNLFLGKFNKSLLSYAEILNEESYLNLENNVTKVGEYLDSKGDLIHKIDKTNKIHPDLLSAFKKSGLFGMTIPVEHQGAGMLFSEVARCYEELGVDLSLCNTISTAELLGHRALLKAGSDQLKAKYLPLLATGDLSAAWCLAEENSGSDPSGLTTTAVAQGDSFVISGKKVLVTNALNSQLLTVVAKTADTDNPTCFLVDRAEVDPESVKISSPLKLAGLRGLEVSDVEFVNCKIPKTSVLGGVGGGLKIVQSLEHQNKYLQACGLIKYLKNLLNDTIEHCNTRRQFGSPLSEFSLIREKLGRMAGKLYSLESVTYLTAGLADASKEPDIEVESVITRQFASEVSDYIVSGCLQILGANVNLETSKYQKYLGDNLIIQGWQGSCNLNKCFVALSCLMHLIQNNPDLAQIRQPADGNFKKMLGFQMTNLKHSINRVVLTHNLYHSVSPGLQTSARRLEWCVHKIPFVAEELLVHRGANIQVEENYLARIHDLVTEVYVMTAVLSRASRSLTLGLENFELEATIAVNLSHESKQRVKQLCMETVLCTDKESNRDAFLEKAGDYVTRRGAYVAVHPLTKNSF